jgi:Protein of unknown function (DUF2380)
LTERWRALALELISNPNDDHCRGGAGPTLRVARKDAIKERKAAPMRMCNVTLVEITEALARKCHSAIEAVLVIFLAIMAGGGANAGPDGKQVPRLAFLGFEFINTSLEATARVEVERIRLLDDLLRQKLTASSRFEIVDIPPDTIKEIASGPTISNCNGCQRKFAQRVGANWAAWGTVQKVSNLILNINVYMEDAESGKMKFARSVDIRGNTDESWRRGLDYLLRNYLLREP